MWKKKQKQTSKKSKRKHSRCLNNKPQSELYVDNNNICVENSQVFM